MIDWMVYINGHEVCIVKWPTYRDAWRDARSHWSQLHSSRFRIERAS